jgi:uncharacterized membrane protein YkgB
MIRYNTNHISHFIWEKPLNSFFYIKQGSSFVAKREKRYSLGEVWRNQGNPKSGMDVIAT